MDNTITKEGLLHQIKTHIENSDKFVMTRNRKLPMVFARACMALMVGFFLFVPAFLTILSALSFSFILNLSCVIFITLSLSSVFLISISDCSPNEKELQEFKKKLAVSIQKYPEIKPFLTKVFPSIQKNNIGFFWYSQLNKYLDQLDAMAQPQEEPKESLEDILFVCDVIKVAQSETVLANNPRSAWKF